MHGTLINYRPLLRKTTCTTVYFLKFDTHLEVNSAMLFKNVFNKCSRVLDLVFFKNGILPEHRHILHWGQEPYLKVAMTTLLSRTENQVNRCSGSAPPTYCLQCWMKIAVLHIWNKPSTLGIMSEKLSLPSTQPPPLHTWAGTIDMHLVLARVYHWFRRREGGRRRLSHFSFYTVLSTDGL